MSGNPKNNKIVSEILGLINKELRLMYHTVQSLSGIVVTLFLSIYFEDKDLKFGAIVFAIFTYLAGIGYGLEVKDALKEEIARRKTQGNLERFEEVLMMITTIVVVTFLVLLMTLKSRM